MLGETIHITMEYLPTKRKQLWLAPRWSHWKLRKELIKATDEGNTTREKVKALTKELRVEKLLTLQKDEQL